MIVGRPWTPDEDLFLTSKYPSTCTREVAKALNRSSSAVISRASELGVKKTKEAVREALSKRYDAKIDEINSYGIEDVPINVAFKHAGWLRYQYESLELSTQDIADLTSCTRKNIEYWMRKHSIPRRDNTTSRTTRYRDKISATGRGRVPFSKGLTKYDHPSIMLISEKVRGERSAKWKGGVTVVNSGYRKVRVEDHPNRDRDGYVFEHRLVMEFLLARLLTSDEVVHHRDHNRQNNLSENLFLFPNNRAHSSFHAYKNHVNPHITEEEFMSEVYQIAA